MIWLAIGGAALFILLGIAMGFHSRPMKFKHSAPLALALIGLGLCGLAFLYGFGIRSLLALWLVIPAIWSAGMREQAPDPLPIPPPRRHAVGKAIWTEMLAMHFDPENDTITGRVRQGYFAGRDMAWMSLEELLSLFGECQRRDEESLPSLVAWLDRFHPGWEEALGAHAMPDVGPEEARALALLGLTPLASEADIREAYRHLMRKAHPDRGGSAEAASQLNAARDLLLQRGKAPGR